MHYTDSKSKTAHGIAAHWRVAQICAECPGDQQLVEVQSGGELLCKRCGLIAQDRLMSQDAEWRDFAGEDGGVSKSRVGFDSGDSIGSSATLGTQCSQSPAGKRFALVEQHYVKGDERRAREMSVAIRRVARNAELSSRQENEAHELYKALATSLPRKKVELLAAALMYVACEQGGHMRDLGDLCRHLSPAEHLDVQRAIAAIRRNKRDGTVVTFCPIAARFTPQASRLCGTLGLPHDVAGIAATIASVASTAGILSGSRPSTLVAAAVAVAAGETCTVAEVARAAEKGEKTLRKAVQTLRDRGAHEFRASESPNASINTVSFASATALASGGGGQAP